MEGIDAALKHETANGESKEFDALLLCDREAPGQQMAAQAGRFLSHSPSGFTNNAYSGYPIICIPIGTDAAGLPFSLSIQHSAWKEDVLIKWASAIERLVRTLHGERPTPQYQNHLAKNIPIERKAVG